MQHFLWRAVTPFSVKWNEDGVQPCHPIFAPSDMRRRRISLACRSTEGGGGAGQKSQAAIFGFLVSGLMNISLQLVTALYRF